MTTVQHSLTGVRGLHDLLVYSPTVGGKTQEHHGSWVLISLDIMAYRGQYFKSVELGNLPLSGGPRGGAAREVLAGRFEMSRLT